MPHFRAYASETQYMSAIINVDSIEEVQELIDNGEVDWEYTDSDNFETDEIEEITKSRYGWTSVPKIIHPTINLTNKP